MHILLSTYFVFCVFFVPPEYFHPPTPHSTAGPMHSSAHDLFYVSASFGAETMSCVSFFAPSDLHLLSLEELTELKSHTHTHTAWEAAAAGPPVLYQQDEAPQSAHGHGEHNTEIKTHIITGCVTVLIKLDLDGRSLKLKPDRNTTDTLLRMCTSEQGF